MLLLWIIAVNGYAHYIIYINFVLSAIEPTTSTSIITPSTSLAQSTIATTTQKASETTTTSPSGIVNYMLTSM